MDNVFYVPGLSHNLISLGCIADKGFTLIFDNKRCLVLEGCGNIVGDGVRDKMTGLYRYVVDHPTFPICIVESIYVG